jgi:hypothetical protein
VITRRNDWIFIISTTTNRTVLNSILLPCVWPAILRQTLIGRIGNHSIKRSSGVDIKS